MVAAAGPGELHAVSLRQFNTIEHYFVEGLSFDLIKIYISDLDSVQETPRRPGGFRL